MTAGRFSPMVEMAQPPIGETGMDEVELRTELLMLKGQVDGLTWLVNALVLALTRAGVADLRKVVETFAVVSTFVKHTESEVATIPLESSSRFFAALLETPELDPLTTMITSALLHADAGEEKKAPLQSWLAQATEGEIAQELEQLFSRLLQRPAPDNGSGA